MSLTVVYTKDGEERQVEFENEGQASIFITGLENHDHRSYDVSFEYVQYDEEQTPYFPDHEGGHNYVRG